MSQRQPLPTDRNCQLSRQTWEGDVARACVVAFPGREIAHGEVPTDATPSADQRPVAEQDRGAARPVPPYGAPLARHRPLTRDNARRTRRHVAFRVARGVQAAGRPAGGACRARLGGGSHAGPVRGDADRGAHRLHGAGRTGRGARVSQLLRAVGRVWIRGLPRNHGKERFRLACERAVGAFDLRFEHVDNVLKRGLEHSAPANDITGPIAPTKNVRGSGYYVTGEE